MSGIAQIPSSLLHIGVYVCVYVCVWEESSAGREGGRELTITTIAENGRAAEETDGVGWQPNAGKLSPQFPTETILQKEWTPCEDEALIGSPSLASQLVQFFPRSQVHGLLFPYIVMEAEEEEEEEEEGRRQGNCSHSSI